MRPAYGWLSKLWSLFGSLVQYGTYYLEYPKRNPNFDYHPYDYMKPEDPEAYSSI